MSTVTESTITEATTNEIVADDYRADALEYRTVHTGSLIGLLLGVVSGSLLFAAESSLSTCLMLLPIPLAGLAVSLLSARTTRQHPEQYIGYPAAVLGIVLSVLFAVSGVARASYVYLTEVPEGYERISFFDMKPDRADELAGRGVPQEIVDLLGQRVFIKGYIRPDSVSARKGIDEFLLVRDSNACCFGDMAKVKYYDQLQVKLVDGLTTEMQEGNLYRVAGRLVINVENLNRGPGYPVFALVGDYVRE